MKLNSSDEWDNGDGAATVQWPSLRSYPPLLARHQKFEELVQKIGLRRPALAQPDVEAAAGEARLSVRRSDRTAPDRAPARRLPDGRRRDCGVVDDCGRVFDASRQREQPYHEGLVVLDGSIVPASLGINPALTIATLALRAIGGAADGLGLQERARWREHRQSPLLQATGSGRAGQGHADRSDRTAVGSGGHRGDEARGGFACRTDDALRPGLDQGPGLRDRRRHSSNCSLAAGACESLRFARPTTGKRQTTARSWLLRLGARYGSSATRNHRPSCASCADGGHGCATGVCGTACSGPSTGSREKGRRRRVT